MISNASLHEEFLVVVATTLSQRHSARYWERGYRHYCRAEMELAEAPTDGARALESGGHDDVDSAPDSPAASKLS
jgi:hypothetical protein